MIDYLFMLCVHFLLKLAQITGTTYEFVNVVIFVFLWPAVQMFTCMNMFRWRARALHYKQQAIPENLPDPGAMADAFLEVPSLTDRARLLPGMRFMSERLTEEMLEIVRRRNNAAKEKP